MSTKLPAFIFDLNGTMIDDMSYHINAWYQIFVRLGAGISPEQAKLECYGKNAEVLERVFPGRFEIEERNSIGLEKEKKYREDFLPSLKLLNGLSGFLATAHAAKIPMAIGSAAIMSNIDFVLDGLAIRNYFQAIVSADDVKISKPDPETFLQCAAAIKRAPGECIVFEDSPKGVEAAASAGMKAVVLTTMHTADEFGHFDNVIFTAADYLDLHFLTLIPGA